MNTNDVLLIAASLTICAGFRAFIPIFVLALLGHLENSMLLKIINPTVKPLFFGNEYLLYISGLLAFIEVMGDKSEAYGNFLDAMNLILRPLAGGFIIFCFLRLEDPVLNYVVSLFFGVLLTVPFHSLKANARFLSQDFSYSSFNTYLSITEDLEATAGSILSVFLPVVSVIIIPITFLTTLFLYKKWKTKLLSEKELQNMNDENQRPAVVDMSLFKNFRNVE
jgi:hypothetical protein